MDEKWYTDPQLPFYKPAYTCPHWLTAMGTADFDIFCFHFPFLPEDLRFSFDYYEEKIAISVSFKPESQWRFELFIPPLNAASPDNPEMDTVCLLYQSDAAMYQSPVRKSFSYCSARGKHFRWEESFPPSYTSWGFYLGELAAHEPS